MVRDPTIISSFANTLVVTATGRETAAGTSAPLRRFTPVDRSCVNGQRSTTTLTTRDRKESIQAGSLCFGNGRVLHHHQIQYTTTPEILRFSCAAVKSQACLFSLLVLVGFYY